MDVQVIIPVGPGHEKIVYEAIKSATDLGFEVIPIDDTQGKFGRSQARNIGVRMATAEWLFFLDADDLLHKDAKKAKKYKNYDAIWGLINDGQVRRPQLRSLSYRDLLKHEPTQTLQMGHFVRRSVAVNYPFNEALDCGEDFDYYIRIWRDCNCIKIPHTLFINRRGFHSKGPRSADGTMWRESVERIQHQYSNKGKMKKVGPFYLPACDEMFVHDFSKGRVFDKLSLDTMLKYCKNKRVALDCGAHVGSWSFILENEFEEVHSFEPSEDNFACLKKNTSKAKLHKQAIGEAEKKVSIIEKSPKNTGQNYIKEGDEIDMISIDSLNLDNVDFIKFDVEGYEPFAVEGAKETLKRCDPVVLIEQNGLEGRYGREDKEAGKILEEYGYILKERVNKDYIYAK